LLLLRPTVNRSQVSKQLDVLQLLLLLQSDPFCAHISAHRVTSPPRIFALLTTRISLNVSLEKLIFLVLL
jgi:trehalose/maltose hydrolase-like predicted phosphorylase